MKLDTLDELLEHHVSETQHNYKEEEDSWVIGYTEDNQYRLMIPFRVEHESQKQQFYSIVRAVFAALEVNRYVALVQSFITVKGKKEDGFVVLAANGEKAIMMVYKVLAGSKEKQEIETDTVSGSLTDLLKDLPEVDEDSKSSLRALCETEEGVIIEGRKALILPVPSAMMPLPKKGAPTYY